MNDAVIAAITRRVSAGRFAPDGNVSDKQIHDLAELATRAPTAYNLQNWRMIAVRSAAAKARLKAVAFGQAKIEESAVTFIICGQAPSHRELGERLLPAVEAGFLPSSVVENWIAAVKQSYDGNAMMQRDEAIRSATLGAAFLIFAAEAYGLASCHGRIRRRTVGARLHARGRGDPVALGRHRTRHPGELAPETAHARRALRHHCLGVWPRVQP
ncbi:nitroreductase family protein [Paracoccus sp. TOH]|uniref:nitroreductase family protein n=1 Tax=Paracoccus sp. TOH TaxID=1263728 RepID=UPI0025AF9767|nr:nitroreductase family protein [Paracoccus sp. TOH]WJS85585.1 nitroreductase family protein [Paracoccus sp. TOH]